MRLCFGGSFNPIHHAHLICARAVAEARGFDKIVLIPSFQPPHKQLSSDIAPAADRLTMCRLAVHGDPLFEVDDIELARGGPSFTIDTARELRRRGWSEVNWLIGADMAHMLPHWHEPEALLREVRFVLMARPGWVMDWSTLPAPFRALQADVVTAPLLDISATEIRQRLRQGKSINYLTPPAVVEHIRRHKLYR